MATKIPPDVLEFFREQGSRGGKIGGPIGGKRSLETMTRAQRVARARKAGAVSAAKRRAKAKRKTST